MLKVLECLQAFDIDSKARIYRQKFLNLGTSKDCASWKVFLTVYKLFPLFSPLSKFETYHSIAVLMVWSVVRLSRMTPKAERSLQATIASLPARAPMF